MRLPHTDWLQHRLSVSGPAPALAAFRAASCGAGIVPWQLDADGMEEDWFNHLAAAGQVSLHGAGVLARQLREAVTRRHGLAVARIGRSRACPFDLHALVPVPAEMLRLGPDHPEALRWLWERWGTCEPLRHVVMGAPGQPEAFEVRFWSADWSPWRALAAVRADWPTLRFELRPHYAA